MTPFLFYQTECDVSFPNWVGDGYCDRFGAYNTEACGWVGGDCCLETCVPGSFPCTNTKECLDPQATSGVQIVDMNGDGECVEAFWVGSYSHRGVRLGNCNRSNWERWVYDRNTGEIKNVANGWCLGYFASSSNPRPITASCSRTDLVQEWVEGDNGRIASATGGKCLCYPGNTLAICNCNTSWNQEFLIPDTFFG